MAKNGNILNTISSLYRSLTKTEKKIADAILLNPDLAVQAPLAEIATHLEVGEATFVRFCPVSYTHLSNFSRGIKGEFVCILINEKKKVRSIFRMFSILARSQFYF